MYYFLADRRAFRNNYTNTDKGFYANTNLSVTVNDSNIYNQPALYVINDKRQV